MLHMFCVPAKYECWHNADGTIFQISLINYGNVEYQGQTELMAIIILG